MTVTFDVKGDFKQAQALLKELGPAVERAASRAINKTATPVRAESARQIQQKRALKIGLIKKSLVLRRATYRRLIASIEASGKPIPIRHFGANQTRQGVTVRIAKKSGRRRLQKHGNKSFQVQKIGNNVFVRVGRKRLPIEKWPPVPGIPTVFVQRAVVAAMESIAATVWPKRWNEEINFEFRKAEAKAAAK